MADTDEATQIAIERLRVTLPSNAPELWAALADPVNDRELDDLRRAIDPWPLPPSVETWLRFADGSGRKRFPIVESELLSARYIAEMYRVIVEFQPPGLIPISYESHVQASVVMDPAEFPALVNTTTDSVEWQLLAPSLAGALSVIADLAEEGVLRDGYPPHTVDWRDPPQTMSIMGPIRDRYQLLLRAHDWTGSPFPPFEWFTQDQTPASWGTWPEGY